MEVTALMVNEDDVAQQSKANQFGIRWRAGQWLGIFVAAMVASASLGCDGCESGDTEVDEVRAELIDENLQEQVVAVVRLMDFEQRYFDTQHWWAETVGAKKFFRRDQVRHGIPDMPATDFRDFVNDVLSEQADHLEWEAHVDIVVWQPAEPGEPWRWAASVPQIDGAPLADRVNWTQRGQREVASHRGADEVTLFSRSIEEGDDEYFVSEIATPRANEARFEGRAITISNFEEGAARLGEAVLLTGDSGRSDAELYLWPRRSGIDERHLGFAEVIEHYLAQRGNQYVSARAATYQLQAQLQRAMSSPQSWPEQMRIAMAVEREEESPAARRVEFVVDLETDDSPMLSTLADTLEVGDDVRQGPRVEGAAGEINLTFAPGGAAELVDRLIPQTWLHMLHVGQADDRRQYIEQFEQVLSYNAGPTTVAFYSPGVPMGGLVGATFVGFQVTDPEAFAPVVRQFHTALLQDFWQPVFELMGPLHEGSEEMEFGGETLMMEQQVYNIGHGYGIAGVCWTIRGDEFLAYYGLAPCKNLREAAEFRREDASGPALSYRGGLQAFVDRTYAMPGEEAGEIFGDIDIEISADFGDDGQLRLSAAYTDLHDLANIIDGVPLLAEHWRPVEVFGPEARPRTIGLTTPTYQDPALMTLGVPGIGGMLPASYYLGMPFSFPPTSAGTFQKLYNTDPERHGRHVGHSH